MTARMTYIAALSFAFLLGLAGTVLAAKALGKDSTPEASPAVHQPAAKAPLPTVEC